MSVTVPDQTLMAEAADTLAALRARCAELETKCHQAEELADSLLETSGKQNDDQEKIISDQEKRIEFLEADRLRLANLIHPDSGICTVYAGKCWECDKEMKRLDEQTANLIRREADAKAARDVATRSLDLQRQINQNLTLQQEQRNADVRALCDAVSQLMPTSRTLKPLVEKVRKGLE